MRAWAFGSHRSQTRPELGPVHRSGTISLPLPPGEGRGEAYPAKVVSNLPRDLSRGDSGRPNPIARDFVPIMECLSWR